MKRIKTAIPFAGFYDSIWSGALDTAEEQEIENLMEEWPTLEEEIQGVLISNADYNGMHQAIAYAYADAFKDLINEELGLAIELGFKEMTSPREYNFTTDRIFCKIPVKHLETLFDKVGREAVAMTAREMFTSRSGFISFYDPDIETWGPLEDWDANQASAILDAAANLLESEAWDLREYLSWDIDLAYNNNVDWVGVGRDLQHLMDVANGEAAPDAREFPPGSVTNPTEYVRRFYELNKYVGGVDE